MLGRQSPQGELFRSDNLYADYVGRDSFYGFLREYRQELFRDEDFSGLYRDGWGRPGVPPSQLCLALLLQAHPEWNVMRVRRALRSTASNAEAPTRLMGWGILDGLAALRSP